MSHLERGELFRRIDAGIKAGVARAIAEHKRAGHSIPILRDNEVVWLTPDEIPDEPEAVAVPAAPGTRPQP
ncbi:MAG: hypothetical protein NT029_12635 [Armatimonadetes bacterium]|nr:hypothetical protein [Armatimonadota bacterium]